MPPPPGFDENPEWTAADTRRAKRGAPFLWREAAKLHLREAIADLEPATGQERVAIAPALNKMREALADLERAG